MSTEKTLIEAEGAQRAAARAEFIKLCWADAAADKLVAGARAAGLSLREGEALLDRVRDAMPLREIAASLPTKKKALIVARSNACTLTVELTPKITMMQGQIKEAEAEVQRAFAVADEAQGAAVKLSNLCSIDPGLVPACVLPPACLNVAAVQRADNAEAEARRAVDAIREVIRQATADRASYTERLEQGERVTTGGLDLRAALAKSVKTLKKAEGELPIAEVELRKASAAHDACRKRVTL